MTGSALQATAIQAEVLGRKGSTNSEVLVQEYIEVKGLTPEYVDAKGKRQLANEAVKFMHLVLLRDLRPPWLDHDFPHALPGEGRLARFTRPSFLYWPANKVPTLFGATVHEQLASAAADVDLVFAGVIARPLHKCTEVVDTATGEVCMNVASMSRFLQKSEGRSAYQCRDCIARLRGAKAAPGSASAVLRGLWVYPMVQGAREEPTPLRVPWPIRLLMHAPPATWGWRIHTPARQPLHATAAAPETCGPRGEQWYTYTAKESEAIWLASHAFKATPPVVE